MMMAILLLLILFIFGFIKTILYKIPPSKLLAHIQTLLPHKSIPTTPTKTISTVSSKEKRENKKKKKKTTQDLEKIFATFDKNGDGFITKQELSESLKSIGLFSSYKEVGCMVSKLDTNGDGLIDIDEFYELYDSMGKPCEDQGVDGKKMEYDEEEEEVELREAFDVFDGDRDGLISVEELDSVLSSLGLKQGMRIDDCKEMIKKVDIDGDGMVNFDEFKMMMRGGGSLVSVS